MTKSKDIRPIVLVRYKASGHLGWKAQALSSPRPIYGLDALAARPQAPVGLVEGEKTADAAARAFPGHVFVTWAGGSQGVTHTDFSPLKGREVTLWADNDDAGKKAMSSLAVNLKSLGAKSVKQVALPLELPPKWDLADPVPEGVDIHALMAAASEPQTGLRPYVLSASALAKMDIPPREYIVEPFLPRASISMVYAERGIGKTWFVLTICKAVCTGDDFLSFNVPKERRVLYVDGEMATYDLKSRVIALDISENENLLILPSELLFQKDRPLNINDPEDQARLVDVIEQLEREGRLPDLVVLDNLSSLSGGIDENDNSALDALLKWLTGLRHKQLAVLIVHHAGKSGDQRGASRREDLLDTSIRLSRPKPKRGKKGGDEDDDVEDDEHDGAFFDVQFVKSRGIRPNPHEFKLKLEKVDEESGKVGWDLGGMEVATAADKLLKYIGLKFPRSQAEIAEATGQTKGSVSQKCKELREKGYIDDKLNLTEAGLSRLKTLWPKLSTQFVPGNVPI